LHFENLQVGDCSTGIATKKTGGTQVVPVVAARITRAFDRFKCRHPLAGSPGYTSNQIGYSFQITRLAQFVQALFRLR